MAPSSQSASTLSQTWIHAVAAVVFIVQAAIGFNEIHIHRPIPGSQEAMFKAAETLNCEGQVVLAEYTGVDAIDQLLRFFVVGFLPAASGADKSFWLLQVYFLVSFYPVLAIWMVEAGRKGNRWSFATFPSIYAPLLQTIGGGVVIPLYYLGYLYTSRRQDYFSNQSRTVSTAYAKALIPALVIGYLIPTVLLYMPIWDAYSLQMMIAIWQPTPLIVSVLVTLLTPFFSSSKGDDVSYINTIHIISMVIGANLHVSVIAYYFSDPEAAGVIASAFDFRTHDPQASPMVAGLKYIFQMDFWICFAACMIWAFFAVYDLNLLKKTNVGPIQAVFWLALGCVLLGPAATLAATWYWREQVLSVKPKRS